jgi:hypothetical protein
MRLRIATVMTLASVPLGVAVGLWMAVLTEPTCIIHLDPRGGGNFCPRPALTQPRFTWWMCALMGAAAAVAFFGISRLVRTPQSHRARWMVASVLRVFAPAAGVGVGIALAQFVSFCNLDPVPTPGPHVCAWQTTFPLWSLILLGAAAAIVVLLGAQAIQPHEPRSPSQRAVRSPNCQGRPVKPN